MQKSIQWGWLDLGFLMAALGSVLKIKDVAETPGLFQFVFFSGPAYILMICGFTLMILALGYDLLFE